MPFSQYRDNLNPANHKFLYHISIVLKANLVSNPSVPPVSSKVLIMLVLYVRVDHDTDRACHVFGSRKMPLRQDQRALAAFCHRVRSVATVRLRHGTCLSYPRRSVTGNPSCCAQNRTTTFVESGRLTSFARCEPNISVTAKHPLYHRFRAPSGSRRSASLSTESRGTRQVASDADRPIRRSDWPGRKK